MTPPDILPGALPEALPHASPNTFQGTLYGVGVGPGDPELLTLKAVRLIAAATVVGYVTKPGGESRSLAIVARHLNPTAIHLPMVMDFALDRSMALAAYRQGALALSALLAQGHDAVVLCEGDPFLYGSFAHLLEQLLAVNPNQPVSVIPGITSPLAASALALRPLAQGDDVLLILPATLPEQRLIALLSHCEAAAIMKIGRHLDKVRRALAVSGLAEGALCVIEASNHSQQVRRLVDTSLTEAPYFSLVLAHRGTLS